MFASPTKFDPDMVACCDAARKRWIFDSAFVPFLLPVRRLGIQIRFIGLRGRFVAGAWNPERGEVDRDAAKIQGSHPTTYRNRPGLAGQCWGLHPLSLRQIWADIGSGSGFEAP